MFRVFYAARRLVDNLRKLPEPAWRWHKTDSTIEYTNCHTRSEHQVEEVANALRRSSLLAYNDLHQRRFCIYTQ